MKPARHPPALRYQRMASLPKAWRDPSSEALSTFVLSAVVGICALVAVGGLEFGLVIYRGVLHPVA